MIILDKPYVSQLLINSIAEKNIPILESSAKAFNASHLKTITQEQAIEKYNKQKHPAIYSNSENAINWIVNNLPETTLPKTINYFKNKNKFRTLLADLYPDFFFKGISLTDLNRINSFSLPKPFIIKPSIGFFSMGVYKVDSDANWKPTLKKIDKEMQEVQHLYPKEVMDATEFIIEKCIEGDEYAFDAYFNVNGEPVIVGIYKHLFSSGNDVSDRVYYSSKQLINEYIEPFKAFLKSVASKIELKNFPLHTEVRINEAGEIIPIEINPMRFGGWCTTADLTTMAFNFNPYQYFFEQRKPNWNSILKDKDDLIYAIVILNNSTGYSADQIESFNYSKLTTDFTKIIDVRKTDWHVYPLFGIAFIETPRHKFEEIEKILMSDLKEYINLK